MVPAIGRLKDPPPAAAAASRSAAVVTHSGLGLSHAEMARHLARQAGEGIFMEGMQVAHV